MMKLKPDVERLLKEAAALGKPCDLLGPIFMKVHEDTIEHALEVEYEMAESLAHAHESSVKKY